MIKHAGALLGLVIATVALAPAAAPIQPSYATSGSMAPAITEGDLYFVQTFATPTEGDIATFYDPRAGRPVTHRIVDRTDAGLITQGDANPDTDQDTGHPPVHRNQIIGTVLTVGGTPVTFSGMGPIIGFIQGHRLLLIGLAAAVILFPEFHDLVSSSRGRPERSAMAVGHVVRPLFTTALAFSLIILFLSASTHTLVWVAVAGQAEGTHAVAVGEKTTRDIEVETIERFPSLTTSIVEANGMEVLEKSRDGSTVRLTVELPALDEVGPYRARVSVYPYPATLPRPLLETLHGVHWLLAAAGSVLPTFVPLWLTYFLVADRKALLRPPRSRWIRRLGGG